MHLQVCLMNTEYLNIFVELFTEFGIAKSAALDIWGFGLVLQELITLKHAFYPVNDPLFNLPNQISKFFNLFTVFMLKNQTFVMEKGPKYPIFEKITPNSWIMRIF